LRYEDYKFLCNYCDKFLTENINDSLVSIPAIHVLKEHPEILNQYEEIFSDKSSIGNIVNKKNTSNKLDFFKSFLRNYLSFSPKFKTSFPNVDVVFISHLININHLKDQDDFYFSNLPNILNRQGISSMVILLNQTKEKQIHDLTFESLEVPRYVIPSRLGLFDEIIFISSIAFQLLKIRFKSISQKNYERKILQSLSRFGNIAGALFSLRLKKYLSKVFIQSKPKILITIYEGHAWERIAYSFAFEKEIHRIGYQHSVVTRDSHAMLRSLGKKYDPDLIYTSGSITQKYFENHIRIKSTKTKILGSSKLLNRPRAANNQTNNIKTCLVIPEGLVDECKTLFEFSCLCARRLKNVRFIWRLHPQISFSELNKKTEIGFDDLPSNILISTNTLDNDIASSTHVLYRGSTAVIESIYGGLIPVYLSDNDEMTIDILHELDEIRPIVKDFDDFESVILNANNKNISKLQNYSEKYFYPLNEKLFISDINNII